MLFFVTCECLPGPDCCEYFCFYHCADLLNLSEAHHDMAADGGARDARKLWQVPARKIAKITAANMFIRGLGGSPKTLLS
jgi:hypothetical protein